jgi:DNA-binding transcriptional MerR regulator
VSASRTYRVKDVSRIAGVSVRTLHHYDAIGLLVPRHRSDGNYRLYTDDDLLRLQQILIGRELGLSLDAIGQSLDDPGFDRRAALVEQRAALEARAHQTAGMIRAVTAALAVIDGGGTGETMDITQIFDGFDPAKYDEEAQARWGGTKAYQESVSRTRRYGEKEWAAIKAEQAGIVSDLVAVMHAGTAPSHPSALAIAERHRLSMDRWFYPCSLSMHRGLADMNEADGRYAATLDKFGKGVTPYLIAAMRANADRG